MNCPNCNAPISCGCQRRVASNGAQVCASCLAAYEQMLRNHRNP
jgi:RNA polymerase-binding transcription factor DksA